MNKVANNGNFVQKVLPFLAIFTHIAIFFFGGIGERSVEEKCSGSCWGGVGGFGERSVEEKCSGSCWGGVGGIGERSVEEKCCGFLTLNPLVRVNAT